MVLGQIVIYLLVPLCFKMSTLSRLTCSQQKSQIRKSAEHSAEDVGCQAGGVRGGGGGLLRQRKECV